MIVVLGYVGGEIRQGAAGVEYSIHPRITFPANEATQLIDVKQQLYTFLGYSAEEYILDLWARYDIGAPGPHFFQVIPLYEEQGWQMIFQQILVQTNWRVVELYIEPKYIGVSQIVVPEIVAHSRNRRKTLDAPRACSPLRPPSPVVPPSPPPILSSPSVDVHVDVGGAYIAAPEEETVAEDSSEYEHNTDADPGHISDENDNNEPVEENPDVPSIFNYVPQVVQPLRAVPLVGRFERHHVASFHDISGLSKWTANESFFGPTSQYSNALSVGRTFESKDALISAICQYHVNENVQVRFGTSNKVKLRAECKDKCGWKLYAKATGIGSSWEIRKCTDKHECRAPANRLDHAQMTTVLIADVVRNELKEDMDLSIKNVRGLVQQRFPNVRPSYSKLWRGRELAMYQLFGTREGTYGLLIPLLEAIKLANPGTKYELHSKPLDRSDQHFFKCVAWAFGPCIEAISQLRPVFCIDAAHLSGRHKGRVLTACGYDADNKLMPIAFALVEKEDSDNWGWFMSWLRREVIGFGRFMCVISDRHKAIKWVFRQTHLGWNENDGECTHRLCAQHISENLYKECKSNEITDIFNYHTVRKKKPRRFDKGITALAETCSRAIPYLRKAGKYVETDENEIERPWKIFQCLDGGYRWGVMTSNGSETLNNVFKHSRRLLVTAIVEDTFYKCVQWFVDRRHDALKYVKAGKICSPKVESILKKTC